MNTEFVKALAQFQGAVGNITRDASGMVGHRSYNYSTLGQIMSVIRSPLSEAGLAVVQVFDDQRLTTKLLHAGGEIVSSMTLNLQGLSPQQAGAVISYFRRYQLSSLLCLATEEDTDAADIGEPVNGKASKLASTFSMAPPPPMGLKQQLIASLAEAQSEASQGRKPAVVHGNGITLLKEEMRAFAKDLELVGDVAELEGLLRSYQGPLEECEQKLADWHTSAIKAISDRRRALSVPS
jgi:ERF superfamily protein